MIYRVSLVNHSLALLFNIDDTRGLHLLKLMLEGILCKFFLLLLGPAQVCSPEGQTIGDQNIEHANIQSKPPVKYDGLPGASFAFEKDELAPCHQACQDEVEDSHKTTDLSQEASKVDIMHKKDDEDA